MFDSQNPQHTLRRVAVVGSGLAGLVVAKELQAAGVEARLFEKSRGPGGRMAARRLPTGGSADIGAQYFTIRNPVFRDFLTEHVDPSCWGPWQGRFRYQDGDDVWQALKPAERFVGIPRMSAITRSLSEGLDVQSDVRIEGLERMPSGLWQLTDATGGQHGGYDAVVLTPPPVQTMALLADSGLGALAGDLGIRTRWMQACWTLVVHFPRGTGADFEALMPNSGTLHWAANNSSKPGRQDRGQWWVLHGDPDWSDDHTDTDPGEVQRILLDEFLRCSGIGEVPGEMLTHRWLYARPRARTGPGHLWFDEQRIGLAGDWLDGGRVEGAFNSAAGLVARLASLGLFEARAGYQEPAVTSRGRR